LSRDVTDRRLTAIGLLLTEGSWIIFLLVDDDGRWITG
jgi:hypothetical protein